MTGEELGEKLLAAAKEMASGKGKAVYSPMIAVRTAAGLSQAQFAALIHHEVVQNARLIRLPRAKAD